MSKWSKKKKIIVAVLASLISIIIIFLSADIYQSNCTFTVSFYQVESDKIESKIKAVQLSDLHVNSFGQDNKDLIDKVIELEPDIIFLTGDIIDRFKEEKEVAINLISDLSKIAPLYASLGNHEKVHSEKYSVDIRSLYEDAGAVFLEKEYKEIEINNQKIRLGGIFGYCLPEIYIDENKSFKEEADFIKDFQNTELYTVLLCHMPVCFIENGGLDYWDCDLVFSGHAHGGQIRIPLLGGVYGPDQGLFPGEMCGIYSSVDGEKNLVLSRGLGSGGYIPRINNIPEVVVTEIIPKGSDSK